MNTDVASAKPLILWVGLVGAAKASESVFIRVHPWFKCLGMLRVLVLCLISVSAQTAQPIPAAESQSSFVPVFVGGQERYACYRIPAMVTTTHGVILAVADGRISGCSDIPNPLDLVLKRSLDNGRTWTPLQVIADYGKNTNDTDVYPTYGLTNPIARVAAGDAALLLDRTNGRIWVIYDNGAYIKSRRHNRALKLELRYTDDDGLTWSLAVDIEAKNPGLRPAGTDFMASPGNGIQLASGPHAGRLIFPAYIWADPYYSTVIYSDDHGKTWHRGGNAAPGGGEIQVAETHDGRLLATIRNNTFPEKGVRFFNTSEDGGETWGTPYYQTFTQAALPDPKCQASILKPPPAEGINTDLLILSNAADAASRTKMTLRISYDQGQTWPVSNLVYAGSSAYSSLTTLPSGEVGMLFEMDGYKRISFLRRSIKEITRH
jgi:sialidase-1